jgi:hypothetical protein
MPTRWQTFPIEFRGGLRSDLGTLVQGTQATGSATTLQNFEPAKEGGYRKILGYVKFDPDEVPGVGPVLGVAVTESSEVVASRENALGKTEYFYSQGAGWTSAGATTTGVSGKVQVTEYKFGTDRKFAFADKVNYPVVYNTATNTTSEIAVADLLGASWVNEFKHHLFVAVGNQLYFSEPFSDSSWTPGGGAGVVNVGQDITGLAVFRDELFIFSYNKIQKLSGSSVSDFVLNPVAENMGCICGCTIQEVGGDVAFMAPDGVRLLSATDRNNDFGLNILSDLIPREYRSFSTTAGWFNSLVLRGKAQYRLFSYDQAVPKESTPGLLFTKFADQGPSDIAWATTMGFKVHCCDSRYTPEGEVAVFGDESGFILRMEVGSNFDGTPIEAVYRSPDLPVDDPKVRKTFYRAVLYTDVTGAVDFKLGLNFDLPRVTNYNKVAAPEVSLLIAQAGVFVYGSSTAIYGTATYGAELDYSFETPLIGSGNTFTYSITDNSTSPTFTIDSIVFDYQSHDKQ